MGFVQDFVNRVSKQPSNGSRRITLFHNVLDVDVNSITLCSLELIVNLDWANVVNSLVIAIFAIFIQSRLERCKGVLTSHVVDFRRVDVCGEDVADERDDLAVSLDPSNFLCLSDGRTCCRSVYAVTSNTWY